MENEISLNFNLKRTVARSSIVFIANVIVLYIISFLNIGVHIDSFEVAVLTTLIIAIVNSLSWPVLSKIFLPFLVFSFGVGNLILNGLMIYFLSFFIDGFIVKGYGIILGPFFMSFVTTLLSTILTIDDDSNYYRSVLRRASQKQKKPVKGYPGVIIVEIDGLSKEVLDEAVENSYMPTVENMLESKTHKVKEWETDLSSQTGSSQAGILHGNNKDITAFRWVEKENNNKMVECSSIKDTEDIEKKISDGKGLLSENGASRSNMFSGDTDNVIFTSSKVLNIGTLYNNAWYSIFVTPNNFARIMLLCLYEIFLEMHSQIEHLVKNIQPRLRRGIVYTFKRIAANVFIREINTGTLIGDIMIGDIDIAYSTYLGYDEIAHHSGVKDKDSFNALKAMDKQIRRLCDAIKLSDRNYQIVIQSDHGQTSGATFKQRYGKSFEKFIRSLLPEDMSIFAKMSSEEKPLSDTINPFKTQMGTLKDKYSSILEYIKNYQGKQISNKKPEDSEVIVLASGNLAMIYLTQWRYRLTYEDIVIMFPELIPGIVNNPYVGFILVKSRRSGDLAIGSEGIYYLDTGEIEGENPLKKFGKHIVQNLKRNSAFKHTPDILVNSFYDEEKDEVCAFEEQIGSHGGVGGNQSKPFILYPKSWTVPDEILGSEEIYRILKENSEKLKSK